MSNEITAEEKARMVMLAGLNYDQGSIASEVGVSESSVSRYLNEFEQEAKDSGEPERVFWRVVMGGMFGDGFRDDAAMFLSRL